MITAVVFFALLQASAAPGPEELGRMDRNGDGRVSQREYREARWIDHRTSGVDPSGRVTVEGVAASLCRKAKSDERSDCRRGARRAAAAMDRNHDGFIDRFESDADADALFTRSDTGRRGYLTPGSEPAG